MQKSILIYLAAVVTIAASTLLCGCTVLGFAVGSSIEKGGIERSDADKLRAGQFVTLTLRDGDSHSGTFNGWHEQSEDSASAAYIAFQEVARPRPPTNGYAYPLLPPWGTTMHITPRRGEIRSGRFVGFGVDSAHGGTYVRLRTESGDVLRERLSNVRMMQDSANVRYDARGLRRIADAVHVPLLTAIRLRKEENEILIPLYDVDQLNAPRGKAALAGLFIGASIDALIVLGIALAFNSIGVEFGPVLGP